MDPSRRREVFFGRSWHRGLLTVYFAVEVASVFSLFLWSITQLNYNSSQILFCNKYPNIIISVSPWSCFIKWRTLYSSQPFFLWIFGSGLLDIAQSLPLFIPAVSYIIWSDTRRYSELCWQWLYPYYQDFQNIISCWLCVNVCV